MVYHRPIPERKRRSKAGDSTPPQQAKDGNPREPGLLSIWVQAEKMMQIALVLPCAAFVGWLAGAWLDSHFHQSWIALVGIVFGGASGLVYAIRLAIAASNDPAMQDTDEKRNGGSGTPS